MNKIEHHVFAIEGSDNVGKTTLINEIKKNYCDLPIEYKKYPIMDSTTSNFMRNTNGILSYIDSMGKKDRTSDECKEVAHNIIGLQIGEILLGMSRDSEILSDNAPKFTISDRGPLSTFLYQYTDPRFDKCNKAESTVSNFIEFLNRRFYGLESKCMSTVTRQRLLDNQTCIHNIVLYNNSKKDISHSDIEEIVEYKRQFDNDKQLQHRINENLKNIVDSCKDKVVPGRLNEFVISSVNDQTDPNKILVSVIPVYIFDEDGNRKTPSELAREVVSFIRLYIEGSIEYVDMTNGRR